MRTQFCLPVNSWHGFSKSIITSVTEMLSKLCTCTVGINEEVQDLLGWRRGYAIYPPWESLAEADKSHNLRANLVDPASTTVMHYLGWQPLKNAIIYHRVRYCAEMVRRSCSSVQARVAVIVRACHPSIKYMKFPMTCGTYFFSAQSFCAGWIYP